MQDRRHDIIQAGLETLREGGYSGFTQPRVAARAGLRQSHLTYYYPTRASLLAAVCRAAIDNQLAALEPAFDGAPPHGASPRTVAAAMASVVIRHENTRVLMALAQAADQEPSLRALFREMTDAVVSRAGRFLCVLNPAATEADARMLHSVAVGLAVLDLATSHPDGEQRAAAVLEAALIRLATKHPHIGFTTPTALPVS